ncbi:MAG: hypothetical protein LQ338_006056 [Usnochroma carphineum]|nr:MAG: hypothetical protein LQ338_006056 [Usnochroma carphineum]
MDSPDRMSWTPSSSAKKRKYDDFIDSCVHIRIPGAFHQSPEFINVYGRDQYLLSPTPPSRFVRPGLAPQLRASMLDNEHIPESFRRLYAMAANAGTKVHSMSSSAVGILAGPGSQAVRYIQNHIGPLYAAVETIGNAAKRIKLTLRPRAAGAAEAATAGEPSTPPQRISNLTNRTPTPAFRTQTSILRNTRETDMRKVRKTLRWVEDQQVISEASHDMIQHQLSFEPVMTGALPNEFETDDIYPAAFEDVDTVDSASSSDYTDSVTPSMTEGLDEEDLRGVETPAEKKARKKAEKAAALTLTERSTWFANQLRAIHPIPPSPKQPTKQVAFYDSPTSGHPITLVKEYSSEDPLTPPVRPHSTTRDPSTPKKESKSTHRLQNTPVSPPVTPETVGHGLSDLGLSQRRSSTRLNDLAVKDQQKRDAEAAEAAQRAAEDAEKRTRLGVRRMPTGPVIQPLTEEWNAKVAAAMRKGLVTELAKTSAGEPIRRSDFGRVLPQRGIDDASGWLNDTMIDAYLQTVAAYGQKLREVRRGALPKVHAFTTYFYTNLSTRGYDSVRRWATKAKFGGKAILDMEKIFIPINKGNSHWVLAHVNPQTKTIEYFDSFHSSPGPVFENIKTWLAAELKNAFVDSEWTLLERLGPKQYNASDCGVFCTTTAKMIVLGVDPMAFSAADMATQRRVMLAELLNGGFDGDFTPNITFQGR